MGRKNIVPYGLYRAEGYVSAHLAKQTGFGMEDLDFLWEALVNMFEHDHSAARGKMSARKLFVFKHGTALGNAPAHKLFELVTVEPNHGSTEPPRGFGYYHVAVRKEQLPETVELIEKL
jgi:CRISPR-associated protein Csd2